MSNERIRIDLARDDEDWTAQVADVEPADAPARELVGREFLGGGPAWALEELGQELDRRDVARIDRERGL